MTSAPRRTLGLVRARNEELIIQETLDHFAPHCDQGIIVLDDCSDDETVEIASRHESVIEIIENPMWRANRTDEEWRLRQILLDRGRVHTPEWFLYFDADERIELDHIDASDVDGIELRLFDAYITEQDAHLVGTQRCMFGPEYRDILFFFKNLPWLSYHVPDQRVVAGVERYTLGGRVRHYGKAISVAQWEATCDYYIHHFPEPYRSKWSARRGQAIHTVSDFGRPLYTWSTVADHQVLEHHAASPPRLPDEALELLQAASTDWYLCPACGEVRRLDVDPTGQWTMPCLRGCPPPGTVE